MVIRAWAAFATVLAILAAAGLRSASERAAKLERELAAKNETLGHVQGRALYLLGELERKAMPDDPSPQKPVPRAPRPELESLRMNPGRLDIRGSLTQAAVRMELRNHESAILGCYANALMYDPEERGDMVAKFIVAAGGHVQKAAATGSTLGNFQLERCVVKNVETWRLPSPGDAFAVVTLPLTFERAKTERR